MWRRRDFFQYCQICNYSSWRHNSSIISTITCFRTSTHQGGIHFVAPPDSWYRLLPKHLHFLHRCDFTSAPFNVRLYTVWRHRYDTVNALAAVISEFLSASVNLAPSSRRLAVSSFYQCLAHSRSTIWWVNEITSKDKTLKIANLTYKETISHGSCNWRKSYYLQILLGCLLSVSTMEDYL